MTETGRVISTTAIFAAVVCGAVIMADILMTDRYERYVASLHKDEPRHMTKEDVFCGKDQITVKAGNYVDPIDLALSFCPEFKPTATER